MGQSMQSMCCCNRDSDEIMKIALGEECDTILKAGYDNIQPINKRTEKLDQ